MKRVVFAVAVSMLLVVSGLVVGWTQAIRTEPVPVGEAKSPGIFGQVGTLTGSSVVPALIPATGQLWCPTGFQSYILYELTLICAGYQAGIFHVIAATAPAAAQDIIIANANVLNLTAAQATIYNATSQELVSYFADRAEAIVPYFLNHSWNSTVYDEIATDSGLAPALEGILTALGEQEYQDWNATVNSWQGLFGHGQAYGTTHDNLFSVDPRNPTTGDLLLTWGRHTGAFSVSLPWEYWTGYNDSGQSKAGASTIYFSMAPGGTVIDANIFNISGSALGGDWFANWTVTDLTTGHTYVVPTVNYSNWANETASAIPILSNLYHFGSFDLFKATCVSGCAIVPSENSPWIETTGAYAFEYGSVRPDLYLQNAMVPHITVGQITPSQWESRTFPSVALGICINVQGTNQLSGTCAPPDTTTISPSEGVASSVSTGPGQVTGGNDTLTQLGSTFQAVLNNSMVLAHAYFNVLRAVTDNGTYHIPADCSIPFPSDAFPAATNPANYQLSLSNTEVVYLSYLESVAQYDGGTNGQALQFCGSGNLGLIYNWTTTWKLRTSIDASFYFGTSSGAVYANGTNDSHSVLSSPTTWPVQSVNPALLFPYEFQMDAPVGAVYAIPYNNPLAAVLLNYSGNPLYGQLQAITPDWGIPTYLQLQGEGNQQFISGATSHNITSGYPNATGDAIYINSCTVANVTQNPCNLAVSYFNNFTFGAVHAFVPISCSLVGDCGITGAGGGGLGPSANVCGFGALNQWYDSWLGAPGYFVAQGFIYLGSLAGKTPVIGGAFEAVFDGLGCLIGWIVVLLIVLLIIYIAFRVGSSALSRRRSR
jgi:hypothetical protein